MPSTNCINNNGHGCLATTHQRYTLTFPRQNVSNNKKPWREEQIMRKSIKLCHEEVEYKNTLGRYGKEMNKQNCENLRVMLKWLIQEDTYPSYEEYKEAFLEQGKNRQWTPEARTEGAIQYLWKYQAGKWSQQRNLKPFNNTSSNSIESNSIESNSIESNSIESNITKLNKSSSETTRELQRIPEESRESQRNVETTETTENLENQHANTTLENSLYNESNDYEYHLAKSLVSEKRNNLETMTYAQALEENNLAPALEILCLRIGKNKFVEKSMRNALIRALWNFYQEHSGNE